MIDVIVKKLDHFDNELPLPFYGSEQAAGADVHACFENKESIELKPFERVLIPTGLAFEIPKGFEIQVRPRSGLSFKTGLVVVNSPGTIDSDYRGEVKIIISNFSQKNEVIEHGLRVAQLILSPVTQMNLVEAASINSTARGEGGFGSTGLKSETRA